MSDELANFYHLVQEASLRARGRSIQKRKSHDSSRPAAKWTSPSRIEGKLGTALAVVLNTLGCSHARSDIGGCTMCSYLLDGSGSPVSAENLIEQFTSATKALTDLQSPITVKIYTSGSFLDPNEVPKDARTEILESIAKIDAIEEVVIESRPEFITEEVVAEIRSALGDRQIELGVGLESSNDRIRDVCINKGFSLRAFQDALKIASDQDIGIRAYVLLKPPFLTERDALIDARKTIVDAVRMGVTTVSVNPVNIQKNTLVERLWRDGAYRPPWLWTVLDVLEYARKAVDSNVDIICDPVAAGKARGAHNCGSCDGEIVKSVREFSLTQDATLFGRRHCRCMATWRHNLQHEDVTHLVSL